MIAAYVAIVREQPLLRTGNGGGRAWEHPYPVLRHQFMWHELSAHKKLVSVCACCLQSHGLSTVCFVLSAPKRTT
jgi:hypothetical protein